MAEIVQMDVLGRGVNWTDSSGYHEGVIVVIAMDPRHGDFMAIVNENNRLVQKRVTELTIR